MPDTVRALREVFHVLKPGGVVKAMIYHVPSWGGLMLYLRCGLARGTFGLTMKEAIYADLESPGTKAYTVDEAQRLLLECGFERITSIYKLIWRIYPRCLVRHIGDRYGLGMLIEAKKPHLRIRAEVDGIS